MKTYRITIEVNESTDAREESSDWQKATVITCDSIYTLNDDIAEWVQTEIDTDAIIELLDDHPEWRNHSNCLDPEKGIHAIDCEDHK